MPIQSIGTLDSVALTHQTVMVEFTFEMLENIVRKAENASYAFPSFFFFSKKKTLHITVIQTRKCAWWVNE